MRGWPTRASIRSLGFPGKYLSELQVLAKLGREGHLRAGRDRRPDQRLCRTRSPGTWGYDQYNLDRSRYTIPVYTIAASNSLTHPLASDDVARYFASLLGRFGSITVPDAPPASRHSTRHSAPRAPREPTTSSSWESMRRERSFSATVDLYLSRTGARMAASLPSAPEMTGCGTR